MRRLDPPIVVPESLTRRLNMTGAPNPYLVSYEPTPPVLSLVSRHEPIRLDRVTYRQRTGPGPFDYVDYFKWVVTELPDAFPESESVYNWLAQREKPEYKVVPCPRQTCYGKGDKSCPLCNGDGFITIERANW